MNKFISIVPARISVSKNNIKFKYLNEWNSIIKKRVKYLLSDDYFGRTFCRGLLQLMLCKIWHEAYQFNTIRSSYIDVYFVSFNIFATSCSHRFQWIANFISLTLDILLPSFSIIPSCYQIGTKLKSHEETNLFSDQYIRHFTLPSFAFSISFSLSYFCLFPHFAANELA